MNREPTFNRHSNSTFRGDFLSLDAFNVILNKTLERGFDPIRELFYFRPTPIAFLIIVMTRILAISAKK